MSKMKSDIPAARVQIEQEREAKDETKDDERTAGIAQGKDAVCARQGVREEL